MKVIRERACDICDSTDGVCRYRITKLEDAAQRTATVDLCVQHGGPVEEAMSAAPIARKGRKTVRPVLSLEEINASKRAAKRAAVKKTAAPRKRS